MQISKENSVVGRGKKVRTLYLMKAKLKKGEVNVIFGIEKLDI